MPHREKLRTSAHVFYPIKLCLTKSDLITLSPFNYSLTFRWGLLLPFTLKGDRKSRTENKMDLAQVPDQNHLMCMKGCQRLIINY